MTPGVSAETLDQEFLDRHGAQFSQLLKLPCITDGLVLLSLRALNAIMLMTDDEIRNNAVIRLSDLRGRLRHEYELMALPVPQEQPTEQLIEEMVDPIKEHFEQFQKNHPKQ